MGYKLSIWTDIEFMYFVLESVVNLNLYNFQFFSP